ncbi:PREDICTED: T-cell surface glycoprotein CD8 alpha chain [Crocodylus porosus]|uniref:T-cell surface glycoprotein CD8 alpha chain n=1 Tax=Crocodylus porosus TaxID=8502 RepID=UPI00093B5BEA|nr:PREDICTED: T-cell surface glycoprotein CD8 alpha chain [Crocodylus porosus]
MPRSLFLLFLLSLCYCKCKGQIQVKLLSRTPTKPGDPVELECAIKDNSFSDSGVSWVHQGKDSGLRFIMFISSISRVTHASDVDKPRYGGSKGPGTYKLMVKSFQEKDQGEYYCIVIRNQMLHFSSGHQVFLPVPPTQPPTTKAASTTPITTTPVTTIGPETQSPANAHKTWLNCDLYIWAPLVGACLFLLVALVVTIITCQKTRRRRCKCRRPANANNGKVVSNR